MCCVSLPLIYFWYSFLNRNMVHVSWNILLTMHDQYQTSVFILRITLGSYIYLYFPFTFYYQNTFDRSRPLAHIILVPYPLFSRLLLFQMLENEVDLDYFYISLKILCKKIRFFKKWSVNNFIYWSPYVLLWFLAIFLTSTFMVSWYSKVFCSSSIEMIML